MGNEKKTIAVQCTSYSLLCTPYSLYMISMIDYYEILHCKRLYTVLEISAKAFIHLNNTPSITIYPTWVISPAINLVSN